MARYKRSNRNNRKNFYTLVTEWLEIKSKDPEIWTIISGMFMFCVDDFGMKFLFWNFFTLMWIFCHLAKRK